MSHFSTPIAMTGSALTMASPVAPRSVYDSPTKTFSGAGGFLVTEDRKGKSLSTQNVSFPHIFSPQTTHLLLSSLTSLDTCSYQTMDLHIKENQYCRIYRRYSSHHHLIQVPLPIHRDNRHFPLSPSHRQRPCRLHRWSQTLRQFDQPPTHRLGGWHALSFPVFR